MSVDPLPGSGLGAAWLGSSVVDLSLTVAEELPCSWPGHMPYQQKTFNYFVDDFSDEAVLRSHCGHYQTRWLLMDEHTGTHVDAPAHFVPSPTSGLEGADEAGAITADRIPLDQLVGPAAVIDVTALVGTAVADGHSPMIEIAHVRAFEERYGDLAPGDVVLFRSDWDAMHYRAGGAGAHYAQEAVIHGRGAAWPAPSVETMTYLADRGVRCVGTDGPSMGSSHDGGPVHVSGLSNGLVFVEALANLAALPARGALFVFAPLKIARGSGAPGRALGFVPGT
ncbi:cyclase family protein [Microbacterium aquimaris]|uniref:Cyclase family protein n=1 Tax=Microbacterium aquimaris TaxID=459816 RepID=A0ABU5N2B9_9MICO|nr:cyclase family protein [Microbacterium aquimaris]MDZ8160220.1 cyclase family protein [Microbacterium aquimaris]